ncbi:MAG: hypothetical protein NTY35_14905 [Planctomycetota bacterium]|nr:hypothetical protein [Planctomycetota bacterium]
MIRAARKSAGAGRLSGLGSLVAPLALAIGCASCTAYSRWPFWSTQQHPGPMTEAEEPLPPGAQLLYPEGPEEVLVIRHADPVKVRPAGRTGGFPLSFYEKNTRVHSGSSVSVAPGGRVEILWSDGTSILMSDRGFGLVGSPSRGESLFTFLDVASAWIDLAGEEQIDLVGGARLSASSGPIVLERVRADIVRVKNQSKTSSRIAFREDVIELDPGQAVDLPLLSAGGRPTRSATSAQLVTGPGFTVRSSGAVETDADAARVRVQAVGEHEIQGLGQRLRLERGEEADFRGLGPR